MFTFSDGKDVSTARLGYANVSSRAIICCNDQGPSMGDLYCPDSNNWIYDPEGSAYPKLGIPTNFVVEYFEVFQVIRVGE